LFHALTFPLGRRALVRGFDVRALLPTDAEWQLIQERIARALGIVESHSPVRYQHLERDVHRIWITGIPSRAAYVHDHQMCVLDFDYVVANDTRPEQLALSLVHEGTHARLRRRGFGYHAPIRARIERVCIRSELMVARRLSGSDDLVAEKEERLRWDDEEWSDATIHREHVDHVRGLGFSGQSAYAITRFLLRPPWRRSNEEL
jgi:hypothetical protein